MQIEKEVAAHYARGHVAETILDALGTGTEITLETLAPYDELHLGGRPATAYLVDQMKVTPDDKILDIGCGLGGAARHTAHQTKCMVTGFDLTPEYIMTATMFSELAGLSDKTFFEVGNACQMAFKDAQFDKAYTIHAAMNISDKQSMYAETFRILKPGGIFAIYDIMALSQNPDIAFPVPWAETNATSFLETPDTIKTILTTVGFKILHEENRADAVKKGFQKRADKLEDAGHVNPAAIIMGDNYKIKVRNIISNVESGLCAPYIILACKE